MRFGDSLGMRLGESLGMRFGDSLEMTFGESLGMSCLRMRLGKAQNVCNHKFMHTSFSFQIMTLLATDNGSWHPVLTNHST